MRIRSRLGSVQRAGLVPHRCRARRSDRRRGRGRRRRSSVVSDGDSCISAAAAAARSAVPRACPAKQGQRRSQKSPIASRARSSSSSVSGGRSIGSISRISSTVSSAIPSNSAAGSRREPRDDLRVEVRAAPRADHVDGRVDARRCAPAPRRPRRRGRSAPPATSCCPARPPGTPLPSHRGVRTARCRRARRRVRPSRSASTPAAEQWFAICSTTPRPPVAMNAGRLDGRLSADVPGPARRSMNIMRREAGQVDARRCRPGSRCRHRRARPPRCRRRDSRRR